QRYNLMQGVAEELDKLALGISSISYMYQALVSLFTQSPEASIYTLNRTVYTNLNFIIENMPIDIALYLEFTKSLIEESSESSIIMLSKLSMIIATYRTLMRSSTAGILQQISTSLKTTERTTIPINTSVLTITSIIPTTITLTTISTITKTIYGENMITYIYAV
ncbi:MAG: hypothetical protein QXF79_03910, partial [Ignisphaera sp.]